MNQTLVLKVPEYALSTKTISTIKQVKTFVRPEKT